MEKSENKSQRVKAALGKLRQLVKHKQLELPSEEPSLFPSERTGDTVTFTLPNQCQLVYPLEHKSITLTELGQTLDVRVDNTGNMREWPSEQILALYIGENPELLSGATSLIELGAGKSGLSGFLAAKLFPQAQVGITDGNQQCVERL
jgi:predicted nicotinamide N-methyase